MKRVIIYFTNRSLEVNMTTQEYQNFQSFMLNDKLTVFEYIDEINIYYCFCKVNIMYFSAIDR